MLRRNDKSTVADAILLTVCAFCYQGLDTCEGHAVTGVVLVQHGPSLAGSPVPRLLTVALDEHLSPLLFRVSDLRGLMRYGSRGPCAEERAVWVVAYVHCDLTYGSEFECELLLDQGESFCV